MLDNDLPYLEPLLFWLQDDENLKQYFTEQSFFMPHAHLADAAMEAMKKDCPVPRVLWILPGDTNAQTTTRPDCKSPGIHVFKIMIIVQCIRDSFVIKKSDDKVYLSGQYMLLSGLRKLVKNSVLEFYKDHSKNNLANKSFADLVWVRDQNLYPPDDEGFLITSLDYQVKLF